MRATFLVCAAGVLALAGIGACSAGGGSGNSVSGSGAGDGSGATSAGGMSGTGGDLNGPTSGSGGGNECVGTGSQADVGILPADVILVVDNSGSMTDEAGQVQASMNDFANTIVGANIDVHVILISANSGDEQGVCVPAPLGSGSCPNDENLAGGFMHVVDDVGSSDGLNKVIQHHSAYESFLRPNATKTIGIITDDNASYSAAAFRSDLVALDPTFADFTFHGIVAPYDYTTQNCIICALSNDCVTQCDPCCGLDPIIGAGCLSFAEEEGTVYKDLADDTTPPGVIGDLCQQQFLPMFQQMATAVIGGAQVSCLYDIPEPPNGQTIDYGQVNVEFLEMPSSQPELFFKVPSASDCGADNEWHYDDEQTPSQILLCPDTCTRVQGSSEGKINVTFGCATEIK